jgi:hypothetical protein
MAAKPVFIVLTEFVKQGIRSVRLDALTQLCESGQASVDAQVKHLLNRGEALTAGGRIYLATEAESDEEFLPEFMPAERQCRKCSRVLPSAEFAKKTQTSRNVCRECRAEARRETHDRNATYSCRLCDRDFMQGEGPFVSCCGPCRKTYPQHAQKLRPIKKGSRNVQLERLADPDEGKPFCVHCGRGHMPGNADGGGSGAVG